MISLSPMTFTWFFSQPKPVKAWQPNCQQLSLLDFLVGVKPVCNGMTLDSTQLVINYIFIRLKDRWRIWEARIDQIVTTCKLLWIHQVTGLDMWGNLELNTLMVHGLKNCLLLRKVWLSEGVVVRGVVVREREGERERDRVSESVAIWQSDGEAQNILRGTILVKWTQKYKFSPC